MSGIGGWSGWDADLASRLDVLDTLGRALSRHDGSEVRMGHADRCGLVAAGLRSGPELHEDPEGALAAFTGTARWSDRDLAAAASRTGMAGALLGGFLDRGPGVLEALSGAFAVAVLVPATGEAFVATDRIGICPVAWSFRNGCLVFASNQDAVQAHPATRSQIDPQGIFDYFYWHVVPAPQTIRRAQFHLLPGQYLWLRNGRLTRETYWRAEYREDRGRPLEAWEEEFRDLLRGGVRDLIASRTVGAFLSGGTDSSTVAGLLGELTGAPPRTYSIGFEVPGYDEMKYARIAARRFGADHREHYLGPDDIVAVLPSMASVYAQPFGNESALAAYHCARMAREDGVDLLLGGDGGDELFGGNSRYARQTLFSYYSDLPAFLRRGLVEPLLFAIPFGDRIWPVRKARSYVRQASVPMPWRMATYHYIERFGAESMFSPGFLASVDTGAPRQLMKELYDSAVADSMLNRILSMELRITLSDNDLPKVSRMCELAGVEVAYPLLSDELVAFAARLPVDYKLKRLSLRWFFKHALRDFLPREILTKKKHGFGTPFGAWLETHAPLQDLCRDSLAGLRGRGIMREEFLDEVVNRQRAEHATYYGVQIWLCVMLEQWFRAHEDSRAGS
jgi:asparagine synthase (glutamine-hydrolysing)